MSNRLLRLTAAALTFAAIVLRPVPASAVTDEEVEQAIAKIKTYFYNAQDAQGTWEHLYPNDKYRGAATTMACTALLIAGESSQHPKLAKALNWLRQLGKEMDDDQKKTYVVSLRCHVWGHLPDAYLPHMRQDAEWLLGAARKNATFHYGYKGGGYDHSNSQYGILGLWEAAKRGITTSDGFWNRVEEHWTETQNPDGGWAYGGEGASKITMTAAGVTALFVAQQELYPETPSKKMAEALEMGANWLDHQFGANNGGMYGLYGIERVGLGLGVRFLHNKDWFETGAAGIIRRVGGNGQAGSLPDTCFSLMFLAHGRHPVWVTKLKIPGYTWKNRPNDIYFLTKYLSDMRESELNFQYVSIDRPVEDLLTTPMVYLSVNAPLQLTDEQKKKLRTYLDYGGFLVVNVEGNNPSTKTQIEDLSHELYKPEGYRMRVLTKDHPLFTALHELGVKDAQGVRSLSNGARELIMINNMDWGKAYFSRSSGERSVSPAYGIAANVFSLATNRGVLQNRLAAGLIQAKKGREATGDAVVGRVKYTQDGKDANWLPEPGAWAIGGRFIFNRTGLQVRTQDVAATDLSSSGVNVAHMTGVEAAKLSPAELDALAAFAQAGGTLIVETVGGVGDFAHSIERQLEQTLSKKAAPLGGDDAMLNGKGLDGGFNNSQVNYRRHAIVTMSVRHRPRLAAFYIDGRPAIILSNEDLSLGMLGVERWGVLGYDSESARRIMTNAAILAKAAN